MNLRQRLSLAIWILWPRCRSAAVREVLSAAVSAAVSDAISDAIFRASVQNGAIPKQDPRSELILSDCQVRAITPEILQRMNRTGRASI